MVSVWELPDFISWSVTFSKAATFWAGCTTSSWLFTFLSTRCRVFSLHRASHSSPAGITKQKSSCFSCCLLRAWQLTVCCQPNPGITDVMWKFLERHQTKGRPHHLVHLYLKQISQNTGIYFSQNTGIYLDKQEKLLCLLMRVQKHPFSLAQQLKCIERCCQVSDEELKQHQHQKEQWAVALVYLQPLSFETCPLWISKREMSNKIRKRWVFSLPSSSWFHVSGGKKEK